MFENKVLKKIFVSVRCEANEQLRIAHNEELRVLYTSPTVCYAGEKL
jgi:hypothetical protein